MENLVLDGTLREKTSKKGTKYWVVEIRLTPNLTKDIFLESAELEVLRLYYQKPINKQENK